MIDNIYMKATMTCSHSLSDSKQVPVSDHLVHYRNMFALPDSFIRRKVDYSKMKVYNDQYRKESERLKTFSKFPSRTKHLINDFVKSGFYYTDIRDQVKCIYCQGTLENWQKHDRPMQRHKHFYPTCPFIISLNVANEPVDLNKDLKKPDYDSNIGKFSKDLTLCLDCSIATATFESSWVVDRINCYDIDWRITTFDDHHTLVPLADDGLYVTVNDGDYFLVCCWCDKSIDILDGILDLDRKLFHKPNCRSTMTVTKDKDIMPEVSKQFCKVEFAVTSQDVDARMETRWVYQLTDKKSSALSKDDLKTVIEIHLKDTGKQERTENTIDSNELDAANSSSMASHGTTHLLNPTFKFPSLDEIKFKSKRICCNDTQIQDLVQYFEETFNFIDEYHAFTVPDSASITQKSDFETNDIVEITIDITRKPAKGKGKSASSTNSSANHAFSNAQSSQQEVSASNSTGLLLSTNINNLSQFHPFMQQNLTNNTQHMLQLAATDKSALQLPGDNTTVSTIRHINNASQPQQQITNAMMDVCAVQLPNIIMPSYNATLSSDHTQQASTSQYPLPVSLSQIQPAQQQQFQLMLNNNQNSFTDLSTTSNNQQQNFGIGGISSAKVQLMQSSYENFGSNSSNAVSSYQMTDMIQGFAPQSVTDNSLSHQNETANLSTNPTSAFCFLPSKMNSNSALTNNSSSSNAISSSSESLYQANVFDLHQTQLYAQYRPLQVQQQQYQQQQLSSSSSNSANIFENSQHKTNDSIPSIDAFQRSVVETILQSRDILFKALNVPGALVSELDISLSDFVGCSLEKISSLPVFLQEGFRNLVVDSYLAIFDRLVLLRESAAVSTSLAMVPECEPINLPPSNLDSSSINLPVELISSNPDADTLQSMDLDSKGHTVTSIWDRECDFYNFGRPSPVTQEAPVKSGSFYLRLSYPSSNEWPVDTSRILYRPSLTNDLTKFGNYAFNDVQFPTMNVTTDRFVPGSTYQVTVYGIRDSTPGTRSTSMFSQPRIVSLLRSINPVRSSNTTVNPLSMSEDLQIKSRFVLQWLKGFIDPGGGAIYIRSAFKRGASCGVIIDTAWTWEWNHVHQTANVAHRFTTGTIAAMFNDTSTATAAAAHMSP